MNLVDKLLKADAKKAGDLDTGVFKSKKLAKILGAETETVDVSIREIKSRRLNDIMTYQINNNGKFDYSKVYDAKLLLVIEGVTDPDLKNKDLQEYFNVKSAKDLADKLFGFEVNGLSDAISALSGVGNDDVKAEEEIKN